jgi:hypothetical protein
MWEDELLENGGFYLPLDGFYTASACAFLEHAADGEGKAKILAMLTSTLSPEFLEAAATIFPSNTQLLLLQNIALKR